jgi:hypothetical protein
MKSEVKGTATSKRLGNCGIDYRGMAGGTAALFFIENDGSLITALD